MTTRRETPASGTRPVFKPNLSDRAIAGTILTQAQASRDVVQDFVPLAESLEWELGQQYLRDRGNKAFISDASPVPFVINNDGTLSRKAAELFFASLVEAEKAQALEHDIHVLELGIGVGLFAKFFLDNFRELCEEHDKDYYERLTYVAADKSRRMLMDLLRHGVLADHPGRFRVRQIDAMEPEKDLLWDASFWKPLSDGGSRSRPFRAVFLNYLLDCLPAAMLEWESTPADQAALAAAPAIKQLYVRTCVARNIKLADYTDMTVEQLREKACKPGAQRSETASQELLEVYGLFASEYDYRPVDIKSLPYGELAFDYGRRWGKRLLLSYGAIQSLERLLDLVHDRGFILVNDYGQTEIAREDEFEHQRFSLATFVGLNFPLLKAYFGDHGKCRWEEPHGGDSGGIHSRLLSHSAGNDVCGKFQELFGSVHQAKLHEPLQKARECIRVGRFELAAGHYKKALDLQPKNWVLLNEVSMFLTFSLRDPKAGIDMARVALGLNPTCSAELWNTLGDGLYEFGRTGEARSAYLKALEVNDSDVRARYNLAWVHVRERNYPGALAMIAEALGLDKTGEYRDRLMQKLQEVLGKLSLRHQQEYLLLINLVSKYAKPEDKPKIERGSGGQESTQP